MDAIPQGNDWQYEPKWDGFRCLAFRDGSKIELQSKSEQPLARYFPELVKALSELEARRFVLDGEIAVLEDGNFSFDALLQRHHPAASRVKILATRTPAIFVVFDLLAADDGRSLLSLPLSERRSRLEVFAAEFFSKSGSVRLSTATLRLAEAKKWLAQTDATVDGIVAKRLDLDYRSGLRDGMQKIKTTAAPTASLGDSAMAKERKRSVRSSLAYMARTVCCITLVSLPVFRRSTDQR